MIAVQFADDNGRVLANGQNYTVIPRIGDHVFNPSFAGHGLKTTLKVFNVVWDMSSSHAFVRIYLKDGSK